MATARKCGAEDVAVHVGGTAPGVSRDAHPSELSRVKNSVWYPVLSKALSVAAGMLGLAAIGVVAGAPRGERVELMSMAAALDGSWLAGAESTAAATSSENGSLGEHANGAATSDVRESSAATSGAAASATAKESEPAPPAASSGRTADGKVILNSAGVDDLMRLPGIGKKRAESILALRERLGRFKSPSDLLRVKGIGPKSLRKMLPHLVLDAETGSTSGSGGSTGKH